jgi:hypothetical protein
MRNRKTLVELLFAFILLTGCVTKSRKVENIHTFAKVYGYVRWYYPGDEASQLDWNKFAVLGVQKVETARNQKELNKIILELFKPIAPALHITGKSSNNSFDINSIFPPDLTGATPVSWEHFGVFLGDKTNIYKSFRINRDTIRELHPCFRNIIPLGQYTGKQIKLSFLTRTIDKHGRKASLFMTLIKKSGFLEEQEPIKLNPVTKWTEYSKILTPGKDDEILDFSIGIDTTVTLFVSDFKLMIKENNIWIQAKIKNGNFENALNYWQIDQINYNISIDSIRSDNGNRCVKIKYANKIPKPGEYITKDIGNDLILKMPIALYNYKGHTFPVADSVKWNSLKREINNIPPSKLTNENYTVRLANIVIAWNVFQHFFPYFDVLNVDWENELTKALINTYSINSQSDYYFELMRMTAKLEDAHISIMGFNAIVYGLKIKVGLFDNDIVVTSSGSELIKKGDIIKSIDGITAFSELKNKEQFISASPNVRQTRALLFFGRTMTNKDAEVTLLRDSREIHLKVSRTPLTDKFYREGYSSNEIIDCGDNIYYLKGEGQDINTLLDKIVNAKGVIIASVSQLGALLPYMIKEPVWWPNMLIPINLYPDREKTLWNQICRTSDPELPHIKAKIAVLTTPDDQSSYETILGIFNYYKLGVTVGDTTAGCNGNVNFIALNGGYSIRWTGMKVLKHDGSQHHLIGFNPDYPVIRTKEAALLGIDEYLQTAIKVLKTK